MRGRMVHPLGEAPQLQRYGRDDSEVIWSVNRGELNMTLLDAAEAAGARLHFDRGLVSVDFDFAHRRDLAAMASGARQRDAFDRVASAVMAPVRRCARRWRCASRLGERFESLGHGYKELEIPPASRRRLSAVERNALHIWPRGRTTCASRSRTTSARSP